jgi:O-antigen ligase
MTAVVPSPPPIHDVPRADDAPSAPRAVKVIDALVEALLVALLIFLPAAFGSVDPWSELIAYSAGGVIASLLAVRAVLQPPQQFWTPVSLVIVLFCSLALLQLIPMPRSVVEMISPNTAADKANLLGDLPDTHIRARALSRMTLSFYPLATRRDLRVVLLAVMLFAAAVTVFRDPRRIRRLLGSIALIGGAVALLALAQDVTGTRKLYWIFEDDLPARSGPFYNHSHFGQFMNLSIGAALGLLLVRLHRAPRALGDDSMPKRWRQPAAAIAFATTLSIAAIIVLGLVTIALSLTRGGVASMVIAGGITTLILLIRPGFRRLGAVLLILAAVALGALFYYGFDRVQDRMLAGGGIAGRSAILRDVVQIVRRFPLLGTGLGTFENVYHGYDTTVSGAVTSHAENEYAQVTTEMGIVGLACVVAFIAAIAARYGRAIRIGGPIGVAAIGLGYGLIAVMVHSLTDFGQHLPSNAALSAISCGLLFNLGAADRLHTARRHPTSRIAALVGALIVTALAIWSVAHAARTWSADSRWTEARRYANRLEARKWEATPQQFDRLRRLGHAVLAAERDSAYYHFRVGVHRWKEAYQHSDDAGKLDPTGVEKALAAIELLNAARRLCPTFGEVYTVLGQIEHTYLNRPIGITHIRTGFELARNDPTAAFTAGETDALRGRWQSAIAAFAHAVRLDYTFTFPVSDLLIEHGRAEAVFTIAGDDWRLMRVFDNAFGRNGGAPPEVKQRLWHRWIDLLDADCARGGATAGNLAMLAGYRAEQGRDEEAERHFARALALEPSNLDWRIARAEALARLGRRDEALAEARTARQYHPHAPQASALMEKLSN